MDKIILLKNKVTNMISGKQLSVILFISIILICVAVYFYRNFLKKKLKKEYVPNKEFAPGPRTDLSSATLYFFYTDWCPHCKTARPIWDDFKKEIGDSIIKDTKIKFMEIDCEKNGQEAEKFNVEGYPTIILVHGNKVIEYDAKTSKESLHQFLDTSL